MKCTVVKYKKTKFLQMDMLTGKQRHGPDERL